MERVGVGHGPMKCGVCGRRGGILEFAFVPYPADGVPEPGEDYEPRAKCPECGSECVEESASP